MRSALSILALVIVLAIVMLTAKKQMQAMKPPASADPSASAASSGLPQPEAVGRQVQDLMKQGEQRASETQ
ncbi:hypothetical protein ACQ86G_29010 [Roseateles chitinivorans]|uniref:hypothetical protein n=1 Tax=Roseateles chitinivorans TaxID=2917965 RepID=UPI003D672F50